MAKPAITAVALGSLALALGVGAVMLTPGVRTSNKLTVAKDARVLYHTLTPKTNWEGPYTWKVVFGKETTLVVEDSLQIGETPEGDTLFLTSNDADKLATRTRELVDTIWDPVPVCTSYRVTVYPKVVKNNNGFVTTKKDSLYRTSSVCRPYTSVELAVMDSYPKPFLADCDITKYQDTARITIGDSVVLGLWGENRYTGMITPLRNCQGKKP